MLSDNTRTNKSNSKIYECPESAQQCSRWRYILTSLIGLLKISQPVFLREALPVSMLALRRFRCTYLLKKWSMYCIFGKEKNTPPALRTGWLWNRLLYSCGWIRDYVSLPRAIPLRLSEASTMILPINIGTTFPTYDYEKLWKLWRRSTLI